MADSKIEIQEPSSPTKDLASQSGSRGGETLQREELIIGDQDTFTAGEGMARVRNSAPISTDYGLTTLEKGGQLVDGTLAATTVAAILGTQVCRAVFVQADPDNLVDILVGDASNQRFQMVPGQGMVLPVYNVNQVRGKTVSSTGNINWLAIV